MKKIGKFFFFEKEKYKEIRDDIWQENWRICHLISGIAMVIFVVAIALSCHADNSEARAAMHKLYSFYASVSLLFFGISFIKFKKPQVKEFIIYLYLFSFLSFGITTLVESPDNGSLNFVVPIIVLPLILVARPFVLVSLVVLGMISAVVTSVMTQPPNLYTAHFLDIVPYGFLSILMIVCIMRNRMQRFYYRFENQRLQENEQRALKKVDSIEWFINSLVRSASEESDLDAAIEKLISHIGKELGTDRAYIFERNASGTFDNTYEWCNDCIHSEKDKLRDVPFEGVVETWYKVFDESSYVMIRNVDEYKSINKNIHDMLKEQGVHSLVVNPLVLDGERIGFFGVDNPSEDMLEYIVSLLGMTEFFITAIIRVRNNIRVLESNAMYDSLTNCKNRSTMNWLYNGEFDKNRPLALLVCDCNSLKITNDIYGHEAGDRLIIRTADILRSVFGADNLYRIGGDEFVVALMDISEADFKALIDKVRKQLGDIASIGYTYKENVDVDMASIFKEADREMYRQKSFFYKKGEDGGLHIPPELLTTK